MLHGEIKINGVSLGHWQARRLQHPPREVNEYACEVEVYDDGPPLKFRIFHTYSAGALALASSVLREAAMRQREAWERSPLLRSVKATRDLPPGTTGGADRD